MKIYIINYHLCIHVLLQNSLHFDEMNSLSFYSDDLKLVQLTVYNRHKININMSFKKFKQCKIMYIIKCTNFKSINIKEKK